MDSDISTLQTGSTLHAGTYRIILYIANGGFGITYLAEHTLLEKRVVIKELYVKEWCNRDSRGYVTVGVTANRARYSKLHAKFISEAKVQCHLNHPGVVKVTDVFEENGTAYYVMDFIDGESLKDRMQRLGHGMPEAEALGYIRQVCAALAYVHSKGRLHLDIKPGNIMIDRSGHAILIDFGVSKQYDAESGENHSTLLGYTPGYSSPEQKSGQMKHFSPASDIYSLGATLYNLLTGKVVPTTDLRISGDPIPPIPANITLSTRKAIDAALQLPKDRRPQSIAAFLEILDGEATAEAELIEETTSFTPKKSNTPRITPNKPNPPKPPQPPRKETPINSSSHADSRQRKIFLWIILAILLGAAIVVAIILKNQGDNISDKVSIEEATAEPSIETPTDKGITFNVKGVEFDMIKVEGGSFIMGSDESPYEDDDAKPAHSEYVKDYYIGATEVTQDLWKAVMGSNPSQFHGGNLPVENVSWDDCQRFCEKLNDITGRNFRLPTEAEWEYAARGGSCSQGFKYSGSDDPELVAWFTYDTGYRSTTHPVALKQPNELGIYDMSGNVYEWTSDLWCRNYSSDRSGAARVYRGGFWGTTKEFCRVEKRVHDLPSSTYGSLGLRLAF